MVEWPLTRELDGNASRERALADREREGELVVEVNEDNLYKFS